MLVKILGGIDIIAGLVLMFGAINVGLLSRIFLVLGVILLTKSLLNLLRDFGSWIDFLSGGILMLSSIILIPPLISVILGLLLLQKGVFSFF